MLAALASAAPFFDQWLPANGVTVHPSLHLSQKDGVRGLSVSAAVETDVLLLTVPRRAMLMLEPGGSLVASLPQAHVNPTELSALTVLYAKYGDERTRDKWRYYVDMLPSDFTTPLWRYEQAQQLLVGSHVLNNTRDRKRHVDSRFEGLSAVLPQWFTDNVSLREWTWALSIVWSRLFVVEIGGKEGRALAPLADMCNSPSRENQTSNVRVEMKGDAIWYYSARVLAPDEELLVDYGRQPKQNTQLILDYGFRGTFVSNQFDYAMVRLNSSRVSDLTRYNLWQPNGYLILPNAFPHQLMKAMRLHLATEQELADNSLVQRMVKHSQPLSLENERAALQGAHRLLTDRLAEFGTSLAFDEAELKRDDLDAFERMVRWQLVAEKTCISRAITVFRVLLDRLARDMSREGEL